ncbi:MAG: hypothetical protein WBE28_00125 [bacterium]
MWSKTSRNITDYYMQIIAGVKLAGRAFAPVFCSNQGFSHSNWSKVWREVRDGLRFRKSLLYPACPVK